jgi:hypothetical protein
MVDVWGRRQWPRRIVPILDWWACWTWATSLPHDSKGKGELRVSAQVRLRPQSFIGIGEAASLKIGRSWTGEEGTSRTHEKKQFGPAFSVSAAS